MSVSASYLIPSCVLTPPHASCCLLLPPLNKRKGFQGEGRGEGRERGLVAGEAEAEAEAEAEGEGEGDEEGEGEGEIVNCRVGRYASLPSSLDGFMLVCVVTI